MLTLTKSLFALMIWFLISNAFGLIAIRQKAVDSNKPIIKANSDFVKVSILHFLFLDKLYHKNQYII